MSISTKVGKQQDSKNRQPHQHRWNSVCACRAARGQRIKVFEHYLSDKNFSRVWATGMWRLDSWPYWARWAWDAQSCHLGQ